VIACRLQLHEWEGGTARTKEFLWLIIPLQHPEAGLNHSNQVTWGHAAGVDAECDGRPRRRILW